MTESWLCALDLFTLEWNLDKTNDADLVFFGFEPSGDIDVVLFEMNDKVVT